MNARPMIPSFCESPGCGAVALGARYCSAHKMTDNDRGRASSRERYGKNWQKLRKLVIERDPVCTAPGCLEPTDEVDHIVRTSKGGDDSLDNLQGLCRRCHRTKTTAERKDDAEIGKRVVVAGPVAAGKTTWVRRNAPPGAMVWDLDQFGALLFNREPEATEAEELDLLLEVRRVIVSHLNRTPCSRPCFIIVSNLESATRIAGEIRGEVVAVTAEVDVIDKRLVGRAMTPARTDDLKIVAREWFVRAREFEERRRQGLDGSDSTTISEVSGVLR